MNQQTYTYLVEFHHIVWNKRVARLVEASNRDSALHSVLDVCDLIYSCEKL